ncbi:MAG: hypothetical protein ACXWLM_03105 [Myxococcales bacterium]
MLALLLASEIVLATGGELAGPPAQTVAEEGADVAAFGFSEVPPKARLQAAFALSDAVARAEIVKLVRVRVEDSLKARETLTAQQIESRTTEVAHGLLPALSIAQHGWRRIKRGDETVLQVWSRVALPKAKLAELIQGAKR